MEKKKLLLSMMVVGMLGSAAVAGGPWGPPMSLLEHGQWALDAAYTQEEMDLYGCGDWLESWQEWEGEGWGSWYHDGDEERARLMDFETSGFYGSFEYGLCDNWDMYVRLGMVDAEGNLVYKGVDVEVIDDEVVYVPWRDKTPLDFGYGFAWQIGSAFTICQHGPWTWGGRMQFGMADPGDDSWTEIDVETVEGGAFREVDYCDADIDFWQAYAYLGPTYQLNEAWSLYCGGGWQTLQANLEVSCRGSEEFVPDEGDPTTLEQWHGSADYTLKHASAIGVFGAVWTPSDVARVGVDVLIGEGGKWGWAVTGTFPF